MVLVLGAAMRATPGDMDLQDSRMVEWSTWLGGNNYFAERDLMPPAPTKLQYCVQYTWGRKAYLVCNT